MTGVNGDRSVSAADPSSEALLRQSFKYLNRFMLLLWRLGLGAWVNLWPERGGRVMVIVHTGRKTGKRRLVPVNYATIEGGLYCVAGFGSKTHWYQNIVANPDVEVWLPDGWWAGQAEDVSDHPDRLLLLRTVLLNSGFAAPLAGVDPRRLDDSELDALTQDYRLIHIRLHEARTGAGGPGEWAWVWPALVLLLLPLALRRRR